MRIVDVKSTAVELPRTDTLRTAYGDITHERYVVVQVLTDQGIVGVGQTESPAPMYGDTAEAIKGKIDAYLKPAVLDQNPFDIEHLFSLMQRALSDGAYAITGIELALWDIKGKALGVPVYQLLGGRVAPGLRLHSSVSRALPLAEAIAEVEALADQGWDWIKSKIGISVQDDLTWYRQMHDAVGDRVRFHLDGNTGYMLPEALQVLLPIEEMGGLALIEQPVRYLDEMVALAARLRTPLEADELVTGPRGAFEIARAGAAHVMLLKMQKYGGLLPARRIAAIAEAAGMACGIAVYWDILAVAGAHLAAATPVCNWPGQAS